jgi:hypothetical protein
MYMLNIKIQLSLMDRDQLAANSDSKCAAKSTCRLLLGSQDTRSQFFSKPTVAYFSS